MCVSKGVVLLGGCGGLGSFFVASILKMGWRVCVADISIDNLNKLKASLPVSLDLLVDGYLQCDVSELKEVESVFTQASALYDEFDVVFCAAVTSEGLHNFDSSDLFSEHLWRKTIDVNLSGAFNVAKTCDYFFRKNKSGNLILVSSIYGFCAPDRKLYQGESIDNYPGYSASKAGLHGLTLWLSSFWGDSGFRVNTLVPGGVFNGHSTSFVRKYSEKTSLNRMAEPLDVWGGLKFLLSDDSSYMTGQALVIDGGYAAR
ncbi:SDR family oxidoreductase [Litoricolaceae bacterium]|nr:SDR family oxidoreductase [Litorivicinaceae bacterium]